MKNKEKFAEEIIELALKYCHFGMDINGELHSCCELKCEDCMFNVKGGCNSATIEWANSEYKEKKEFSETDKAYVRVMDKLNWFAKDKNGLVWGYVAKPFKDNLMWSVKATSEAEDGYELERVSSYSSATFEPLSWDDEEPTHRNEILEDEE